MQWKSVLKILVLKTAMKKCVKNISVKKSNEKVW